MSDCLLIKHVDAALSHEELDEYLYSVLQAVNDTMPPQTVAYVEAQHVELLAKIDELKEPQELTEDKLSLLHPGFCEHCED